LFRSLAAGIFMRPACSRRLFHRHSVKHIPSDRAFVVSDDDAMALRNEAISINETVMLLSSRGGVDRQHQNGLGRTM